MAISGISSLELIVSQLQAIHPTIRDSYDTTSLFYKFIKNYNNAAGIRSFSDFLNQALKNIDSNYHPFDVNHEFNIAIKALGDDPHLLQALFNQEKYRIVKGLYSQNFVLLKSLDFSYQNYLNVSMLSQPSQILAPMYSHQSSQKQVADFVMDDEYIKSLYSPENTFQKLDPQAREHFLDTLVYLRKSTSRHFATLLGSQDNEDLKCLLKFIDPKLQLLSAGNHYSEIVGDANSKLELRTSLEPDQITHECQIYRGCGLKYFKTKSAHPT